MRIATAGIGMIWIGLAFDQGEALRVRGTVRVSGADQPIAGARVAVYYGAERGANRAVVTDGNGAFTISLDQPGSYSIAAEVAGDYISGSESRQSVSIDSTGPARTVNLTLGIAC
jgi:Carboxypeptidase regulatory-like domain